MLNGVSSLFFHFPNHIDSDFMRLIFNAKDLSNFSRRSSKTLIDSGLFRKTVVSSTYCVIFNSCAPTLMSSIFGFFLIASARISIPSTKSVPDNEQPCLTPRSGLKKSEAKPLFVMQLVMLQKDVCTQFLKSGPKLSLLRALKRKFHSMESNAF